MATDAEPRYVLTTVSSADEIAAREFTSVDNAVWSYWHAATRPGMSAALVDPAGVVMATAGEAFDPPD